MTNHPCLHNLKTTICVQVFLAALAIAPFGGTPVFGQGTEPRDYSRFEGLSLMIQQDGAYYPLVGISNGAAVIREGSAIKEVPVNAIKAYRTDRGLVIRTRRATIADLSAARVYTPGNDPRTKWSSSQTALLNMRSEDAGLAEMQYLIDPNPKTAQGSLDSALNGEGYSDMENDGTAQDKIQQELDKQLFDAIQFEFEVSSPRPIPHPYVIIITDFKESENSPGTDTAIYMKELDPIEDTPSRVIIMQSGLTPGYQLVGYEVHLFDNGSEIATNVTKGRHDMTRTEVYDYLTQAYLAIHKGATLPPVSMGSRADAKLRRGIGADDLNRRFEISVGKDGSVAGYAPGDSSDAALSGNAKACLESLHFFPALAGGEPVDGKLDASLADLLR